MSQPAIAESLARPRGGPMRVLALCWITYAAYYLGRVNVAVAMPAIQSEFGWSRAAVGLIGAALYWSYAAGQLVNGHLGDRMSPRRLVLVGLLASAALNLVFGHLSLLGMMMAVWALNGWAQSTGWGPMLKTLSRWFTPAERGRVTALFTPCYVFGHAASWALAGWLVATRDWRYVFWVPGVMLLGFAAIWRLLLPEPPMETQTARPAAGIRAGLATLLRHPHLRWGLITAFLSGMIKDGLTLWGPTYLMEQQSLDLGSAALLGALIPMAGAAGAVLAGHLSHRRVGGGEATIVAGLAGLVVVAAAGLYSIGAIGALAPALALLALIALGSHGMNGLLMTSLPLALGSKGEVSSAAGSLDFASYVGGGLAAALVGVLQDVTGWGGVYAVWVLVAGAIVALALRQSRRSRAAPALTW
jgi:OPA family glycerol-3-phosphate transporter-like MFS transporter